MKEPSEAEYREYPISTTNDRMADVYEALAALDKHIDVLSEAIRMAREAIRDYLENAMEDDVPAKQMPVNEALRAEVEKLRTALQQIKFSYDEDGTPHLTYVTDKMQAAALWCAALQQE